MDFLLQFLVGIGIAALSSLITVRLSLARFRTEKWWEKKVSAYEKVIEAFHGSKRFSTEHMEAECSGKEIAKERDEELRTIAKAAREEILKATDIGSFILSDEALIILKEYENESAKSSECHTWFEYLDSDWGVVDKYMKKIIAEAKRDLKR
jgi:hypothetical protein